MTVPVRSVIVDGLTVMASISHLSVSFETYDALLGDTEDLIFRDFPVYESYAFFT